MEKLLFTFMTLLPKWNVDTKKRRIFGSDVAKLSCVEEDTQFTR